MPERLIHELSKESYSLLNGVLDLFADNTEISVSMLCNGHIYFGGVKKVDNQSLQVENSQAIYEIASLTKVFTSSILALLAAESRLSLDDPISDYLSFSLNRNTDITFRELSTHTSGLPPLPVGEKWDSLFSDISNPYTLVTEQDLVRYMKVELELGEKGRYQYSNLGTTLLGYVLSKIENMSYEKVLQKSLFQPLEMNSSTTDINNLSGRLVKGLGVNGEQVPNWHFNAFSPAGAVLSSVRDLSKFVAATLDGKFPFLQKQMQSHFQDSDGMQMALGWHLIEDQLVFHNGGTGGYTSAMIFDAKEKSAVVVLSNISAGHENRAGVIDELAFNLFDAKNP